MNVQDTKLSKPRLFGAGAPFGTASKRIVNLLVDAMKPGTSTSLNFPFFFAAAFGLAFGAGPLASCADSSLSCEAASKLITSSESAHASAANTRNKNMTRRGIREVCHIAFSHSRIARNRNRNRYAPH